MSTHPLHLTLDVSSSKKFLICPNSGFGIGPHHTAMQLCIYQCTDPIPAPQHQALQGQAWCLHRGAPSALQPHPEQPPRQRFQKCYVRGAEINKALEVRRRPAFLEETLEYRTHFEKHPGVQGQLPRMDGDCEEGKPPAVYLMLH